MMKEIMSFVFISEGEKIIIILLGLIIIMEIYMITHGGKTKNE